jgi:bifunctional DNase/RNase
VNPALTALAAACVAAAVTLAAPAHPAPAMVEMEVAGVFPLEDAHAGVLVLREKEGATMLPIVVGSTEAEVVQRRLKKETSSRPRTHDLLEHAIEALGAKVVRVEIRDASEALYRARVFLAQGAQRVELDARPSDSIALAVSARAPIFAARELVQGAGLSREDLERLRRAHSSETPEDPAIPPEQHM